VSTMCQAGAHHREYRDVKVKFCEMEDWEYILQDFRQRNSSRFLEPGFSHECEEDYEK
jgi:hypothetical protein